MSPVLIDNDVIIKVALYGLGPAFIEVTAPQGTPPAILNVGRFVVRDRLNRDKRFVNKTAAIECFDALLPNLVLLEPSDEELASAAEFEMLATRANLDLDGGESQLLAILLTRMGNLLITGDKRAIHAIALIASGETQRKLACFEQLIASILTLVDTNTLRRRVCLEPLADKATTICCSCASERALSTSDLLEAIDSYTRHVRSGAAGTLLESHDLSALAA